MRRAKLIQLLRQIKKRFAVASPPHALAGRGVEKTYSELSMLLCGVLMIVHRIREFQALHDLGDYADQFPGKETHGSG